ncbi:proteoglycan 4b isoform X1 [Poecilia formosa]|uniref:Proteoglycan 4b n=1 Tax=Poecilia formosa TaxID=48698 RepID=A0A087Y801_POEFO|nr:PREDICTED: proteoglycan 4 isoform X1 [Poecilia formosa]XP_016526348.1 PREDICTED: proteoglycan 4 isoform X1 [Poecilia formosa]XP_016526349.1 PREDICTED: proteoglycan 4 isoform X1 [Poecilia formosa]
MSSKTFMVATLLVCALKFISSQTSCRGRCGAEYYRGNMCQCDFTCLSYDECCNDYEAQCTTKNSCKGRCGETFKRGRRCTCDFECSKFKQCCPDFKNHCDVDVITAEKSGGATGPMTGSSCDNVHNNPKDSTAAKDPELSEGNNADDSLFTPDSLTPYPPMDLDDGDDIFAEIFPNDDLSTNGDVQPEASPTPEVSSGDGLTPVEPLDEIPTEPTLIRDDPQFNTEPTPVDDIFTLAAVTTGRTDPTEPTSVDPDQTTTPLVPSEPNSGVLDLSLTSELQTEPTASSGASAIETEISPSDAPEVSHTNAKDLMEELENSQLTTTSGLSTLASVTEETTSSPNTESSPESITTSSPDVLQDVSDATLTPAGDELLSSTAAAPDSASGGVNPDETTAEPDSKPDPSKASPTSKPESKPLEPQTQITDNLKDYQGDDSDDTNLCSGRPVSGITTLRNGTMVVFRGHYFWVLDRNLVPSSPKGITAVWGVPSPIDTVFTRCNCQGKTYIFKGGKYWRFENDALDPGYPKVVKTGFDGLQGHITAALSVPQYLSRKESVYFFKRGGTVQKYSYQFGTSPKCGRTANVPVYTVRARLVRQAVSVLEPAINIRRSWKGFPSTITAAVSVPTNRNPEGYKYVVFSRSTAYNVRMHDGRPVVAAPRANVSPKTDNFFRCPKKS